MGSHNYLLNDKDSDRDYKLFIMPEFDDLYDNALFTTPNIVTKELDYDIHDIRKLPRLAWKANINYIEGLFSTDVESDFGVELPYEIVELFKMNERIAHMNLPKFFDACIGTYNQKMLLLNTGTESTQELVAKFGYDTKQACHAFRNLDILVRYAATDFESFEDALRYGTNVGFRDLVLDIKHGKLTRKEFLSVANTHKNTAEALKEKYKSQPVDEECLKLMNDLVRQLVRKYIVECEQ